ncbi:hypothetical protein [Methanocella sp. MCL-LM]|uniref:hypothetical protein n=1 Tax=Methanocella sp. MCL-LM TaxID=3412035 RepID=UPI003C77DC3A
MSSLVDYTSYVLTLFIIILGLVAGVFHDAGVGPGVTPPQTYYNASDVINITDSPVSGENQQDNTGTGVSSFGFWSIINGFKEILINFSDWCSQFGVPQILSIPGQALIWTVLGYDALQIKKIIWG